jgi:hypothetical protein
VPVTVFGLPLHPLIVHATVVVIPTAVLAVVLAAVWPRFRRWAGWLPLALAVTGLVLDPLSTGSGENLEHQAGGNALIEKHAQLADGLLPWMIALTVVAAGLYFWHRRTYRSPRTAGPRWLPAVIAGLAVVAGLGTAVQVVRIGHSGAEAAWSDVATSSSSSSAGAGH